MKSFVSPDLFNCSMTVEEKNSDSLAVDQLKDLLDSLPVSRAAMKKRSKNSKIDEKHKEYIEKGETLVCPKPTNDDNADSSFIELDDSMLPADTNYHIECIDQEVPVIKYSRYLYPLSPISLLMEQSQKHRDAPAIVWQEFNNNDCFGCKVSFGDKFWIAPAKYSRKKEARTMAALMACTELGGDKILFENIELEKYESWTKESVRKFSDEIAEKEY